ncbi:MAG: PAS domain-containing sensor histidine kinase [Armatimonadota bacterium]
MDRSNSEKRRGRVFWQRLAALLEWQSLATVGAILILTALHYATAVRHGPYHDLYRRLYYIPVIYGAVRYGLLGGTLLSLTAVALYVPHLIHLLAAQPNGRVDNLAGVALLLVVGILTGALVDALSRRERLAAIGGHASRLVHDVRSPLGVIVPAARMMADPNTDGALRQEMAEMIVEQAHRLADMSGEVLEYARGSDYLALEECHVNQVAKEIADLRRDTLEAAGLELDVSLGEDAILRADAARLQRVITNLLENAKDAMPDGGRVQLATAAQGGRALIEVRDDGPGIPDEVADRLFEPFVTHGKSRGTGLGLAIAREIITAHGGEITVASSPGQGATFTISLPVGRNHRPRGDRPDARDSEVGAASARRVREESRTP